MPNNNKNHVKNANNRNNNNRNNNNRNNRSNSNGGNNITETLYETSAEVGKFIAHFQFAFGVLISIILIVVGVYVLRSKSLTGSGTAKVTAVLCNSSNVATNTPCTATVQFVAGDGTQQFATIQGTYSVGQDVQINYDPKYPTNVNSGKQMSKRTVGIIMITIGGLMLIAISVWYYLILKYKPVAAFSGIGNFTSTLSNSI